MFINIGYLGLYLNVSGEILKYGFSLLLREMRDKPTLIYDICPECGHEGFDFKFRKLIVCPKCGARWGVS